MNARRPTADATERAPTVRAALRVRVRSVSGWLPTARNASVATNSLSGFNWTDPLCVICSSLIFRRQWMLVTQRARVVPRSLSQHSRLLPLQLWRYAWNAVGCWRTCVRGYRRVPDGQWRLFSLLSQHAGHSFLRLSRRIHAGRRLENLRRSVSHRLLCTLFTARLFFTFYFFRHWRMRLRSRRWPGSTVSWNVSQYDRIIRLRGSGRGASHMPNWIRISRRRRPMQRWVAYLSHQHARHFLSSLQTSTNAPRRQTAAAPISASTRKVLTGANVPSDSSWKLTTQLVKVCVSTRRQSNKFLIGDVTSFRYRRMRFR